MARIARAVAERIRRHVIQRGNRRLTTFFTDDDYRAYLAMLETWTAKCGVAIWAYCLMPMGQDYLLAAARYIELNPVRTALTRAPGDWPWSSARAHLAGADDDLVRVRPLLELAPDWREFLHGGLTDEDLERLRRHTRTGRPLGAQKFVVRLENRLGRLLAPQKTGRKSSAAGGQFAK